MQWVEHFWALNIGETFVCQLVEWVGILYREGAGIRLQKLLWFDLAEVKRKMFSVCHRARVILSHNFQHSNCGHTQEDAGPCKQSFNSYSRKQINPPLISLGPCRCIFQFFLIHCCFWLSPVQPWILNAFLRKMHILFQNISLPRMKLQVR